MLNVSRILVSGAARTVGGVALASTLALLAACGQRGPLYLPTDPAAAQRATLPETVLPDRLRERLRERGGSTATTDGAAPAPAVPAPGIGAPAGGLQ